MSGISLTFYSLFDRVECVEIPILQRDYAQGRNEESEVRSLFLSSLFEALTPGERSASQPLDLDFVYGSYENAEKGERQNADSPAVFSVLDGQQRLTTLFLLHWYLAVADDCLESFRRQFVTPSRKSRFTYKTRPSSNEFFNALVTADLDVGEAPISKVICDCRWFYLSWQQDPTVQACLCMLDAIQQRFAGHESGLFDRLTDQYNPCITFQFLDLHSFGLSDELYIKMNARGKPLTVFDNFKARLEQHIASYQGPWPDYRLSFRDEVVSGYDYFIHKVDTDWADLFWPFRNISSADNAFDDEFMHFFRLIIMLQALIDNRDRPEQLAQLTQALFGKAGQLKEPKLSTYEQLGCFSQELIVRLIQTLDLLDGKQQGQSQLQTYLDNQHYYDQLAVFKRIISNSANYDDRLRFFAFYSFLATSKDLENGSDLTALNSWMRVIYNLVENTITDSPMDFCRALFAIHDLCHLDQPILEALRADCKIPAFIAAQVLEEKIKAHLILKAGQWHEVILKAEAHPFFNGQIGVVLNFSGVLAFYRKQGNCDWSDDEGNHYLGAFVRYFDKLAAVFNRISDSSAVIDYAWERAVLSKGIYFTSSRTNPNKLNMLHSRDTRNNIPRDHSWRRRLRIGNEADEAKQGYIKEVLDHSLFNANDLQTSLQAMCEQALTGGSGEDSQLEAWREALIQHPELFDYSTQGFIVHDMGETVLLSQSQRNHYHCELFTKALECELKGELAWLQPFTKVECEGVRSREGVTELLLSGCELTGQNYLMAVRKTGSHFAIGFKAEGQQSYPESLATELINNGFNRPESGDGAVVIYACEQSNLASVKAKILELCSGLRELIT